MVKLIPDNFSDVLCEKMPEYCEETIVDMKEFGMFNDLTALYRVWRDLESYGLKDLADSLYQSMVVLEDIIANTVQTLTNGEKIIAFDFRVGRWRDMITGRFVRDPSKDFEALWRIPIEEYYSE